MRECVGGQSSSFEVMEPRLEGSHGEGPRGSPGRGVVGIDRARACAAGLVP